MEAMHEALRNTQSHACTDACAHLDMRHKDAVAIGLQVGQEGRDAPVQDDLVHDHLQPQVRAAEASLSGRPTAFMTICSRTHVQRE